MEKAKKRIVYEATVVNESFWNELGRIGDGEYGRYHQQNADWYNSLGNRINEIIGFHGQTNDELASYVAGIELTQEQKQALSELRREPMFKRLMGELALQQKPELEELLNSKITDEGMTFADEDGPHRATKTERQIDDDFEGFSDKLSQLLSDGTITEVQYDNYRLQLDYIHEYFISRSKGEQIPFRRMTNAQYEQVENRALENRTEFGKQLGNETHDLMRDHSQLQELQGAVVRR